MNPLRLLASPTVAFALIASTAGAETWPVRPIHVIVPFGAGTTTDIVPRIVFEQVSAQLGQPVIVENRPGAGTTTGASAVAKANADGYTLLVNFSAHTIAPSLFPSLSYDVSHDFAAIAPLGLVPSVLLASPAKGFTHVSDLVGAAKATPGSLNFASAGIGTATHLSAVRFNNSAGIVSVHVPFKAAPEILGEMMAGRIDYFLAPIAIALPFLRDGKLVGLAVNAPARLSAIPDVPTLLEAGFSNADYSFWIAIFAPAKTSRAIIDRLAVETHKALAEPKVRDKLAALGIEPMHLIPEALDAMVARQITIDAELVRTAGLGAK
ncbi:MULTISPECIES: tripartite tricarboxylate transporter substrate-binding protein [unclassified Bradyrhizobium]|uniref:tripartite tricarboxylate transporter substrate-binding protein n=1 Tax=unclassified Bradyrhizobium TaxID=2631580 RepID=UPI000412BC13|nr:MULTISPECIES: tripartite tricarboxylate transporter substrate-binding protein [unclassified Bradyrhizobium]QIG97330.1 tripartite tricarboxylate transporter substrate binding protein [Bradyrhizobium sp. 6(2017)]